jgi:general secretion pathway protein C
MKHMPLVAASLMFVAAGASAAYWGMPWFRAPALPAAPVARTAAPPLGIEAAAGLFGGQPAAATTFQLKGVIDDGPDGVAIVAADGKPPLALGVGQEAAPGVTVREIHRTYVMLNEGGAVRRLDLPSSASASLRIVPAAADDRGDAPGRPQAPRMAVTTVARSGGALPPPVANPDAVAAPGAPPPQLRGIPPEVIERLRASRPSGVGPGAWGPHPRT